MRSSLLISRLIQDLSDGTAWLFLFLDNVTLWGLFVVAFILYHGCRATLDGRWPHRVRNLAALFAVTYFICRLTLDNTFVDVVPLAIRSLMIGVIIAQITGLGLAFLFWFVPLLLGGVSSPFLRSWRRIEACWLWNSERMKERREQRRLRRLANQPQPSPAQRLAEEMREAEEQLNTETLAIGSSGLDEDEQQHLISYAKQRYLQRLRQIVG